MPRNRTIPGKDFDFDVFQRFFVDTSLARAADWNLDLTWINEILIPRRIEWEVAWLAYQNEMTRNRLIILRKLTARKNYERHLRQLARMLRGSPRVTDEDRISMGLAGIAVRRTPVAAPVSYPDCIIDLTYIRRLSVHIRDHESKSKAKPRGVHGAEIRWAILDAYPTSVDHLTSYEVITNPPMNIGFEDNLRGRTVWFCARWRNNNGLNGPWGEIVSAIIP